MHTAITGLERVKGCYITLFLFAATGPPPPPLQWARADLCVSFVRDGKDLKCEHYTLLIF